MNTDIYALTITEVQKLTRESIAVKFAVPENLTETFKFIQGQHLTLIATINSEEVRRSYSICSDVNSQELQIGIKQVEGGVFSNYAIETFKVGMQIEIMAPQGHFYTELDTNSSKHYLLVAAGSGITPVLSQMRSILSTEKQSKVTLLYSNQSSSLMMFKEAISFIKNEYIDRFQWVNFFSREEQEAELFNGRLSAEKLTLLNESNIIQLSQFNEAFICGPEQLIENLKDFLLTKGLTEEQIHYELFFSDTAEQKTIEKQQQRDLKYEDESSKVTVKISGRRINFKLSMKGENILDAALYEGADLPFSCKAGVCATCKAQLVSGEVEMDQNHSLTDEEVEQGMILTCQAHPVSSEVELDFDVV